jgi:hypothetical protein
LPVEADRFLRSMTTEAAQGRMASCMLLGGQTPEVERDLGRLVESIGG